MFFVFSGKNEGTLMIQFIVGITGGSGVGKTTLINMLYEEFEGKVATFSLDNYYLPIEEQAEKI